MGWPLGRVCGVVEAPERVVPAGRPFFLQPNVQSCFPQVKLRVLQVGRRRTLRSFLLSQYKISCKEPSLPATCQLPCSIGFMPLSSTLARSKYCVGRWGSAYAINWCHMGPTIKPDTWWVMGVLSLLPPKCPLLGWACSRWSRHRGSCWWYRS